MGLGAVLGVLTCLWGAATADLSPLHNQFCRLLTQSPFETLLCFFLGGCSNNSAIACARQQKIVTSTARVVGTILRFFPGWCSNNGKDLDTCKPLIDHFRYSCRNYVFVGSAGAYAANDVEPMHLEGDKRKSSAGHVAVEKYLEEQRMPYTVFQPLCE